MSLKIIVLAKQVPDTRNVGKDAMKEDGTINRAALPAIFNPEDLNALEQALRLKDAYPGTTVTLLTMGPGRAAEIIREGLYRGADGGYLLTDRAFAGADTLATSYALATAIKKIGDYDIIIGGRQAIDGDTAQVGPQVAEKLGLTQVTYAEEILNVDEKNRSITVKRHIDGGVETVEGPLPIVITVNGSAAPCRPRNAKLVMKYKRALGAQEKAPAPACHPEGVSALPYPELYEKRPYLNIPEWSVADVSLELLTKGRKLANQLNCQLEAIVAGSGLEGIEKQVMPYGVDKVHIFDAPGLFPYTSLPHSSVLINLFKEEKPQICLMGATVIGRDLGPRVSSALTSGLTADCTSLEIGSHEDKRAGKTYENLLYQIRPAFGGNIVATIINPEHRPQMATVREGVMKKEILDADYKGEVVKHDVAKYVPETDYVVKVIDRHIEKAKHNLKGAPIVVAGGYGMGSKESFDMLFELAKELHAEVGASRAAVDAGFCDHDRQIGQTGVTVRPKLYIACGISGQIQHIAGMQDAGIIISINNDENAPINTIADYVINGTVEEVIPKMIKYYKQNSK